MTRRLQLLASLSVLAVIASSGCRPAENWTPLFDGTSVRGWRAYKTTKYPSGWFVRDGALTKTGPVQDIMTTREFSDFVLEFEWTVGPAGNSGVFYRANEEYERVYWSAPEYQLLDDSLHQDGANRATAAGAAYGLYPAAAGHVKPPGEWNHTRIVVDSAHVEHWLNGEKLLEYELWSPDWEAKVKASKFGAWPNFGRSTRGAIAFQGDHAGFLALRNIRIRELE